VSSKVIGPHDAELEYRILEALSQAPGGVGSGTLHLRLRDRGVHVSQATIGRVLHSLDRRGITTRVSNQGRVLTVSGRHHLADLHRWDEMRYWLEKILADARPASQADHSEALDALSHLDSHLARLAAIHATQPEIRAMKRILELHERKLATMSLGRQQGLGFHAMIAKAARNQFLETAVNMIWSWNNDLREIWTHAYPLTGRYSLPDHIQVFQAIARRDPDRAESAMRAHYQVFIESVEKHFGSRRRPPKGKRRRRASKGPFAGPRPVGSREAGEAIAQLRRNPPDRPVRAPASGA
jgi:GntR family transcriptional regulator, transcriptional repressor for pyruvate dehydrogenase complex